MEEDALIKMKWSKVNGNGWNKIMEGNKMWLKIVFSLNIRVNILMGKKLNNGTL